MPESMGAVDITFQFQHPRFRLQHRRAIRSWLLSCVHQIGQNVSGLHYSFCTDEFIQEANRQYLDHDYQTDILTFPYPSSKGISGDVLISIDRVRDNAKFHRTSVLDETHRVMAHGALHLLGYQDTTTEEQQSMRLLEETWLSKRTFLST